MGSNFPTYPGPQGQNRCPVHPSEPLIGMCGCGTLFCRQCSPSEVFCNRCLHQRHLAAHHGRQVAVAHPGWQSQHQANAHIRPLSHRVLLEALFMTILATLALAALFGFQNYSIASSSAQNSQKSVSYGINSGTEPLQKNTSLFKTTISVPDGSATLTSDTTYTINAKVESTKGYTDMISDLVPLDVLLAWGDMAHEDVDSNLVWEQGDRKGQVSGSLGGSGVDLSNNYVITHVSNNHLIPSSDRLALALKNIRAGDMVRIEGRLVDVKEKLDDSRVLTVNTSKTRSDQGAGACEIIYVEHLRVNGQSY